MGKRGVVAGRLQRRRERDAHAFVGRRDELSQLMALLGARGPRVVVISGPGGVGKSALCSAFVAKVRARAVVHHVDARGIDPTPAALVAALELDRIKRARRLHVIVVDTYESLATLDEWVREELVAKLPAHARLVLSGREPPDANWRVRALADRSVRLVALSNLPAADCRKLLRGRGISAAHDAAILDFTRGHPLALCLLAEAQLRTPESPFNPDESPDVIRVLLRQFLQDVPGPLHRAAVEAAAVVRVTTEPLLAHLLGVDDVHDLFDWLAGRSFIELAPDGVFPHDLVREVITTELRWRDADRYGDLLTRANAYFRVRIERSQSWMTTRDWLYAFHHHPVFRAAFALPKSARLYADQPVATDLPLLLAMIERHEGAESARHAARWFATPHAAIRVIREGTAPVGMLVILTITNDTPRELVEEDPATRAIASGVKLGEREVATIYRWLVAGETYQAVSPVQSIGLVQAMHHDLVVPDQAAGYLVVADVDFWRPAADHSGATLVEEAAFEVGGHRYGVYMKDWRRMPASVLYFEHMLKLALGMEPEAATPEIVALSHEGFAAAVHDAIRDFDRPRELRANTLLYSRLVAGKVASRAPVEERVELLRSAIRETVAALAVRPRIAKFHEALVATYLAGATTQEAAAESLGLAFTTYRYRLARGIERLVDALWQRETGVA
jgi:hypothetical protein